MQNFYDVWSVILDDRGLPLHGRISFYEANTTTLKTIYDVDGNELSNPIYCNKVPSVQVLLGDGDYTIRYERYIGSGNMESDDNESSWFLYKTELYKAGELISTDTNKLTIVNTIAELKTITDMQDGDAVCVLGYYIAGDCPERNFIWHSEGNYTENDGTIIKASSTTIGAWTMVIPGTYIDVRWFGDFADNSANPSTKTSNLSQRAKAAVAATNYHKDLYFPGIKTSQKSYYIFDGANTVAVSQDMIIDNGVRFVIKEGTDGTVIQAHEIKKCEGELIIPQTGTSSIGGYTLIADWIRTSWLGSSTATAEGARIGYIIDYITSPLSFTNTKIKYERNVNKVLPVCTFTNCEFVECNNDIKNTDGNIIMNNMILKTIWFEDDYSYDNKLTISDCTILLTNCKDANTYILLKNKQNDEKYGDLGEQEINATLIFGEVLLENASGTITISSTGVTKLELHNFSGTIKGIKSDTCINAVDCWLTFDSASIMDDLSIRRGNITSKTAVQILGDLFIDNIDLNIPLNLYGLTAFTIKNSNIYCTIDVIGHTNNIFLNNTWEQGSYLKYTSDQNKMVGLFENNIIKSVSSGWVFASNVTDTEVDCKWVNNHSDMNTMFITLDRTNFLPDESSHNYVYEGNTGKNVIQKNMTKQATIYVNKTANTTPSQNGQIGYNGSDGNYLFWGPSMNWLTYDYDEEKGFQPRTKTISEGAYYLFTFTCFSVGITGLNFICNAGFQNKRFSYTKGTMSYDNLGYVWECFNGTCSSDEKIMNYTTKVTETPTNDIPATIQLINGYTWAFGGFENKPIFKCQYQLTADEWFDMVVHFIRI